MLKQPMMTVAIDGQKFYARHGVFEQERTVGGEFEVSVSVSYRAPGEVTDELGDTISYVDLYEIARQEMAHPSELLEHVAYRIAQRLAEKHPKIVGGKIKIKKIVPPIKGITCSASVSYEF